MAITITITSPTGSELPLEQWFNDADLVNVVSATTSEYFLSTPGTGSFASGDLVLRFKSSGNDLTFDGSNVPTAGTLTSLEVFSVALNQVVATITGFSRSAVQFYDTAFFDAVDPFGSADFILDDATTYTGDTGDDTFITDDGADTLDGGDGDDILVGGDGSNDGDDVLNGGEGDDVLSGGAGYDKLNGGNGFDTADYSAEGKISGLGITVSIDGGWISGGESGSPGDDISSIERFIGTQLDDVFLASAANTIFEGRGGKDKIDGGDGDDWAIGGADADIMDGGNGTDTLGYLGAVAGVTVTLGAANVQTTGSGGEAAGDKIKNFENILGGDGNDKLTGNALNNRLFGILGNDTLNGAAGNDIISAGAGTDTVDGGAGDDLIEGGADADKITGNTGIDTVSYENATGAVTVNLLTNINKGNEAEGDKIFTVENVVSSAFDDTITGNALDNILEGGAGADTIAGSGKDIASYQSSQTGVQIDLSIGSAAQTSTGDGNGDRLNGILNLLGSYNADKLTGDTNDNTIEGSGDADELDGGAGLDTLSYATSNGGIGITLGAAGMETTGSGAHAAGDKVKNFEHVIGSAFDDALTGNAIANKLTGGKGNDFFEGYAGADVIDGGEGIDSASYENSDVGVTVNLATNINKGGHAEGDSLKGIEDIAGSDFKDKLTGNTLANTISAGSEDDAVDGGSGNDILGGGGGIDTILGGSGDDTVSGDGGADIMDGGANVDTLSYASCGAVKVKLSEGAVTQIMSAATKVTVNGVMDIELGGNDAEGDSVKNFENLIGSAFDDVLVGNNGANRIEGGIGKDNIDGGKGNDTIFGGTGEDKIFGGDGNDVIEGGAGGDALDGGLGINTLSYAGDTAGVNVFLGAMPSGGDATGDTYVNFQNIRGGSGIDILKGDAGVNILEGGGSNDNLIGLGGKDTLDGGAGVDMASFDGLSTAITVTLGKDGAATTVSGAAGVGSAAGTVLKNIERLFGTSGNDKLTGNELQNNIFGGDGDDLIDGKGSNDSLDGGAGVDTVSYSTSKQGVTVTINANTSLLATGGDAHGDTVVRFENIVGSSFNDVLTAIANEANTLKGGSGNDVVEGGEMGDMLFGEGGLDTLSYSNDNVGVTVVLKGAAAADVSGSTAMGNHAAGDVALGFENLTGGTAADKLTGDAGANVIDGFGSTNDILDGAGGIDTVSYANATANATVTLGANGAETVGNGIMGESDSIQNFENIIGSNHHDKLAGNNLANIIRGGQGNDTLIGGGGADTLDAGDGFDDTVDYSMLTSSQGFTVKLGVSGAASKVTSSAGSPAAGDTLIGVEHVIGGAGNDKLTGNGLGNQFTGNDGDDVLEAVGYFSTFDGGNGSDTVSYVNAGSFVNFNIPANSNNTGDVLTSVENFIGSKYNDILRMALTGSEVNKVFGGDGNDFISGGAGADILDGGKEASATAYINGQIGDAIDYSTISDIDVFITLGNAGVKTIITATGLNASFANGEEIVNFESVWASDGNDKLVGNAADNSLSGGNGDDWIEGGAGNDVLSGGNGINTLAYTTASAGVTVNIGFVGVQQTGGAGKDFISSFTNLIGSSKNDTLGGTTQSNIIEGGDGNDTISGGDSGDTLKGGNGIDTITYFDADSSVSVDLSLQNGVDKQVGAGDENDDILTGFENLTGGMHADILIGDANANVIKGEGAGDIIIGGGGADTLDGGAGIDMLSYQFDTSAVTVKLGANGAQSTVTGASHGTGDKVSNFENVKGSDFADVLTGNNLDNEIFGLAGNDIIDGGLGTDKLFGDGGVNTASYASASAAVTVSLGAQGGFQVTGGAGLDWLENFINLTGSSKNDTLAGDTNVNILDGGAGNDILLGGDGNDTLIGGLGDDSINGGNGIYDFASYAGATAAVTVNLSIATQQNTGGAGKDTFANIEGVIGSKFNDKLTGDANNNFFEGGAGNDIFDGGVGEDHVYYNNATAGITVDVSLAGQQNLGSDGKDTFISIEGVLGSKFDDTITASVYAEGGEGNDLLIGAQFTDGGAGNDRIVTGALSAIAKGGDGDDTFVFNQVLTATTWGLEDFGISGTDKLEINKAAFGIPASVTIGGTGADDFAAEYFVSGSGAVADKAHGQFVFDTDTKLLMWDADGTGANFAYSIASFSFANYTVTVNDFVLV
jgi:Ca2+-binding RTX toxin-like protein